MKTNTTTLLYRILNIWFAFIALLIISNALPHWGNIHLMSWMNVILYFLVFLLAIAITMKDPNNKDIFINFSILFFFYAFSFINVFMGDHYLFGNNKSAYSVFVYNRLMVCFMQNFVVVFTVSKYALKRLSAKNLYGVTLFIALPVFIYCFHPYLADFNNFLKLGSSYSTDLHRRAFSNDLLSVIFIVLFGYLLYKKDIVLGEYINTWMASFFIYVIIGLVNDITAMFGFKTYNISQYFQGLSLVLLAFVLIKKLLFLLSDYGQFYEKLLGGSYQLNSMKIQRRHFQSNSFALKVLKIYFSQRLNYIVSFLWLLAVVFMYFHLSKFITVNVTAFFVCIAILFYFTGALYKKREKQRHIISGIVESDL